MDSSLPVRSVLPDDLSPAFLELRENFRTHCVRIRSVSPETVSEELTYLDRFFLFFGPPLSCDELFRRLCPGSITNFLIDYSTGHGPGSRHWMQFSLRSFLRYAYWSSLIDRDLSGIVPSSRISRQGHVPRCLPDDCIEALMTGIDCSGPAGLRDSAIVCLLSTYGVRGVQIRRLCLSDIDWSAERLCFPAAKGGRPVEQMLTPEAGNRLSDYLTRARPASEHPEVFLTLQAPFGPLFSSSYLSAVIRRRIKESGTAPPTGVSQGTHGFRHAFATRLVGRIPFKDLVDQMGHRDPDSTLLYGKVDLESLRMAAPPWPGGVS